MPKQYITIHDLQTGEITKREMNEIELAEYNARQERESVKQTEADAKIATRQALLNRLGINEEEARILLGGN